jgi:hypothetical protein
MPVVDYEVLRLYHSRRLAGWAVLHDGWYLHWAVERPCLAMVDLALRDMRHLPALLAQVEAEGVRRARPAYLWSSTHGPLTSDLVARGWARRPTTRQLVALLGSGTWNLGRLRSSVHHMIGDSDCYGVLA